MKKTLKTLVLTGMVLSLVSCKSVSPEAQEVIDIIEETRQQTEHTMEEYVEIQNKYDALTEEDKKDVETYSEFTTDMDNYFTEKKAEFANALGNNKYYFSEKEASVGVLKASGDKIQITLYEFDGNGKHEVASVDYDYTSDGSTVSLDSSGPMEIAYSISDGKLQLDDYYFTEEQILDGIQGNWTLRKTNNFFGNISTNEYNMSISGNNAEYEDAASALGYSDGSYYYYGPYSGSLSIIDGSVEINASHGDEYFFSCYNGKVQLYHYGDMMKPGNGLKGEDGYEDAF